MHIEPGTHTLGPEDAELSIRTGRSGAAAKAGHDLLIEVTAWSAAVEAGSDPSETQITLNADGRSLRVREGTGGMKALDEEDKDNIRQTIDDEVLKGTEIEFRSTAVEPGADGNPLAVQGELALFGQARPVSFELTLGEGGRLTGTARLKQSEWSIKPYSALFGALKVADELEVEIAARLPPS